MMPFLLMAHDIPSDATIQALVKPAGDRLQVLVRLPLKSIRDVDFPEQQGGYLDLEKLAPLLPDAATVWIARLTEFYEGETRLQDPQLVATQVSLESDKSFASYKEAAAHVAGPKLTNSTKVLWNQVLLDVLL